MGAGFGLRPTQGPMGPEVRRPREGQCKPPRDVGADSKKRGANRRFCDPLAPHLHLGPGRADDAHLITTALEPAACLGA